MGSWVSGPTHWATSSHGYGYTRGSGRLAIPAPTLGYTRTHSLPVRLRLGLLGKGIAGCCLPVRLRLGLLGKGIAGCWIVGVTRPNVI